jgi:hypothetical protein
MKKKTRKKIVNILNVSLAALLVIATLAQVVLMIFS